MKVCPKCQSTFPEQFSFCQKDGTRLESAAPPPPSFSAPTTQPVARAVPLGQTTNRIEIETQRVEPAFTVPQPALPTAPPAAQPFTPQPDAYVEPARTRKGGALGWLIGLGVLLLFILAGVGGWYFYNASTQTKFRRAIDRGNLVSPAGESAYDYYLQLKRDGKPAEELAEYTKPLVPQLVGQAKQLFEDLNSPGTRDAAPEAWEEAQRALAWAAEINPKDSKLAAQASYAAGRVAYLRGDKNEALNWWKKAYDQDKTWYLPANGLGIIYNERKNYIAARTVLQEAIRREPNSPLPYNNLGTAYLLAKDDGQAEANYQKAVELSPNWPRPHAWLAEIAMRRKDYARAVQEYEMVLSLGATTDTSIDTNKIRLQLEQARKLLQEQAAAPTPEPPASTAPPQP
jgi:tetratricopeptide (TPR) repeat protein